MDQGYDVWLGTNRGINVSNRHIRDEELEAGTWTYKERWDFSWADMGVRDVPAFIETIIAVTQKPTVTYIGYSQGSAQMYYGLAKMQDYFADKINRFIAISPCINPTFNIDHKVQVERFQNLENMGIYNFHAKDEGSPVDPLELCKVGTAVDC